FDLIVAQPPYVPHTPNSQGIAFLHAGPRGDEITIRLLRELPRVLAPGGEALVLSDVPFDRGQDMNAWARDVLGPTGLDLLALHMPSLPPDIRGVVYAGFETGSEGTGYIAAINRHAELSEELGVAELRQTLFVGRHPEKGGPARTFSMIVREMPILSPATRVLLWKAGGAAALPAPVRLERTIRVAPGAEWVSFRPEPEGDVAQHRLRFDGDWPAPEQIVPEAGVALASLLQRATRVADALAGYAE